MANYNRVLVVTASTADGLRVKKYIQPVSAHVVAGTNIFSDFFASFTDVFGGRSHTYQKQLVSLYNEAIDRIKFAAHELGANCVLGLSIDMDEISGQGKSMFMLTAIGTAVIIEEQGDKQAALRSSHNEDERVDLIAINNLRIRKEMIEKANSGRLVLDGNTWEYITNYQVYEVFPFILTSLSREQQLSQVNEFKKFHELFVRYVYSMPESTRIDLLYDTLMNEKSVPAASLISDILDDMNLFNYDRIMGLLRSDDFQIQKRGVRMSICDKPFYLHRDKNDLQAIKDFIENNFLKRGEITTKKQMLSLQAKEVWICECTHSNNTGDVYCRICTQDIFGFMAHEVSPTQAKQQIQEKIDLISEFVS